jgi:aliphatic nitrilase
MRIAAVQDAPVFLDLEASVDHAIAIIREAADGGADLVGFPEGFVPGHPGWIELHGLDEVAVVLSKRLFLNALEIPSPALARIAEVCGQTGTAVVLGACERLPGTTGTLFNTQVFIDESGVVAGKHQKYVPTVGERLVHAPGQTGSRNEFRAHDTSVTGLICGENSNPLAQYAAARAYPTVHVASWPQHFSPAVQMEPVIELVSKALAYSLKCFVVNAVTTISDAMIEAYGEGAEAFLRSADARGRASIVAPTGEVIARATDDSPQLVYADVDIDDVIIPKFIQDTAGHYNRPELFRWLLTEQSRD